CVVTCPYGAITFDDVNNHSVINEILCEGCGTCVAACASEALILKNLTNEQMEKMIHVALKEEAK
ncbi:MAG: CoB--CoM heterodisulfide reductase iron-sulfur subunit A family protein, partial [Asgard group archaeon]|nr:CoB--CoM heterodisulfide reductase iron-sulfur subunit A family protein [Asgard group archaeon]